jgi:hypothetical protein
MIRVNVVERSVSGVAVPKVQIPAIQSESVSNVAARGPRGGTI